MSQYGVWDTVRGEWRDGPFGTLHSLAASWLTRKHQPDYAGGRLVIARMVEGAPEPLSETETLELGGMGRGMPRLKARSGSSVGFNEARPTDSIDPPQNRVQDPVVTPARLREIRRRTGLSQEAFGRLIDRSGRQVRNLERGATAIDRCIARAVLHIEEHPPRE